MNKGISYTIILIFMILTILALINDRNILIKQISINKKLVQMIGNNTKAINEITTFIKE